MRRLLLTTSLSALLLIAVDQPSHSAPVSDSASTPPAVISGPAINAGKAETPGEFPAAIDGSAGTAKNGGAGDKVMVVTAANDAAPIVVIQHDMPPNIDLKARPRIASDLAAALREPSFAIFATAMTFLLGMAVFVLRRILL